MTGTNKTIKFVSATGNQLIDSVISTYAWGGTSITYAFPTTASSYSYTGEKNNKFAAISDAQKQAARFVLDKDVGNAANDGFSVEGFTNVSFSEGSASTATLRLAQSGTPSTAYAYYPFTNASGGDTWFGTAYNYRAPVAGNYAWHTVIHELGHALGLKHGHETDTFGALPSGLDSLEFSVMTYNTFVGDAANGYKYEKFGAPQTFMMADIAALQHMYGADFSTNSGNTVYKWTPGSGNTVIDGTIAIQPGANRIFATIWDGGGTDTFDLTAYTTGLKIDLRPGGFSMFSEDQLAYLGGGPNDGLARGNIFNALLYKGDTRSLIENVSGGAGSDSIRGNQLANSLSGNGGNDTLNGEMGNDRLDGGAGNDRLIGGAGADTLVGGSGSDAASYSTATMGITADLTDSRKNTNDAKGDTYSSIESVEGTNYADKLYGNSGANGITGWTGADLISGGGGNDWLYGASGADDLYGGTGADRFIFKSTAETGKTLATADTIFDFSVMDGDRIDLSGIDANIKVSGNQAFSFVGAFTGASAQVRFEKAASDTYIYGDVNGDKNTDFMIHLDDAVTMLGSYFIL